MPLLLIMVGTALLLLAAYNLYGDLLTRLLRLDARVPTPAHTQRDDQDYSPSKPSYLLGQHFSAIAAAGPIVGPIVAGLTFGWLPALLWIILGSIFIGGVHDMTALVASVRHKARSIAEVLREYMSRRSYMLFLLFVWIALVYIVVAFTDVVAGSFIGSQTLENGTVIAGGATATSSLLYLALPVLMGALLRFRVLSLSWATAVFLPLVALSIWIGPRVPLDLASLLQVSDQQARTWWVVILLGYCFVASLVPVWLLLQPRGHLGGYFLYASLIGGMLGLFIGAFRGSYAIAYPAITGWTAADGSTLAPMLFITIACGACSGFHCLIASGTTSKQLASETDAKPVGYGAMLAEAMVAAMSVACVMLLSASDAGSLVAKPNYVYARGLGTFLESIGIPPTFAISFGMLAFTTFVYDTLDVCTRLGRYIVQELTGWQGTFGKWFATAVTALIPLFFVTRTMLGPDGKPIPLWRVFWSLFGASNQLLAALALIGVTVWLWRTTRAWWVWLVTGIPTLFMYVMSAWALTIFIRKGFRDPDAGFRWPADPVPWVALLLLGLAAMVALEAILVLSRTLGRPPASGGRSLAAAPQFTRD